MNGFTPKSPVCFKYLYSVQDLLSAPLSMHKIAAFSVQLAETVIEL